MLKRLALIFFATGMITALGRARLLAHEGHEHKVMGTVTVVTAVEQKDKSMLARTIEVGAASAATK